MSPLNKKQYLIFLIAAGIMYFCTGLICHYWFTPVGEPLFARLPAALLLFGAALLVKLKVTNIQNVEKIVYVCITLVTLHFCLLVHITGYHPTYLMGQLVVLLVGASMFFKRKALIAYFIICLPPAFYVINMSPIDYSKVMLNNNYIAFSVFLFILQYTKIIIFEKLGFANAELKSSKKQIEKNYGVNLQAAHDLGSPLSAINAVAHILEDENPKLYSLLQNSVSRINQISSDLLDIHKESKHTLESDFFDLENNISQIVTEKKKEYAHTKNLYILYRFSAPLLQDVHIPKSDFQRVLSNLINNGIDASKKNDEIRIKITVTPLEKSVEIRVDDNGYGIDKDKQALIFNPNVSFKEKGTGLGLSHAKATVESWGGQITLHTSSSKGTCFRIEIPYAPVLKADIDK